MKPRNLGTTKRACGGCERMLTYAAYCNDPSLEQPPCHPVVTAVIEVDRCRWRSLERCLRLDGD